MPSYNAVISASPTLYRRKPGFGSGVFGFRTVGLCWLRIGIAGVCGLSVGPTRARLLSRPSTAPATAADRITSRRDVVRILAPLERPTEQSPDSRNRKKITPKATFPTH